jgi:hypothetical protein
MTMFDWGATDEVVSSYFWVYWAVTIPLTILVVVGWRLWWGWEERNYQRDLGQAMDNVEKPG